MHTRSTSSLTRSILGGLVCSLLACAAGSPGVYMDENAVPADQLHALLLLPANFDYAPAKEFARGTSIVAVLLTQRLEEAGHQALPLSLSDTRKHWFAAVDSVGGILDETTGALIEQRYEQARSALVRRLLAGRSADAVVMPTLFIRQGHYVGRFLRWDGISRPAVLHDNNGHAVVETIFGDDLGTSVRLSVFARDGRKVFERYAGIEPLMEYIHRGGATPGQRDSGRVQGRRRADLFRDRALLQESVQLALSPWISPPAERAAQ